MLSDCSGLVDGEVLSFAQHVRISGIGMGADDLPGGGIVALLMNARAIMGCNMADSCSHR